MTTPLTLTREQSRRIDEIAISQYGFTGLVLMENAGRGACDVLLEFDPRPRQVAILCGKGNNAGDGFVLARHLHICGIDAKVLLLAPPQDLQGDALANYTVLKHTEVEIVDLSQSDSLLEELVAHAAGASWLVDALLGTGATGAPREPYDEAIHWMNAQDTKRLALDVPSGLDCDSGVAADPTVRAGLTCTFATAKVGFDQAGAAEYLGEVRVVSIGVPAELVEGIVERNVF